MMKKKMIGGLLAACTCVLALGATQLNAVPADAAGVSYNGNDLIAMVDGASVRVADTETSGIRFAARVSKAEYDALETTHGVANVKAGMIIVPTDYLGTGAATAFTHEALNTYGKAYTYQETSSFKLSDDGEYYEFFVSLVDLDTANYTRDFCATAYIKVANATAIDGNWSVYNGAQYNYADFNQETDARNIVAVASEAYNDRKATEEGEYVTEVEFNAVTSYSKLSDNALAAAKSYMDKVAVVTNEAGVVADNDTDYYTSPYQIGGANGSYVLDGKGVTPLDVVYNGEVVTDEYITDGDVQVAMVKTSKATYAGDVATVENGVPANSNPAEANYTDKPNGYVAFRGDYGVGTFIDVNFKGNNMPYVTFFANNINGIVCRAGGTGLMMVNGMVTGLDNVIHSRTDVFRIYTSRHNANFDGATATTGEFAKITQAALAADETKEYKLTAGTVLLSGKVNVYIAVADVATGAEVVTAIKETTLTTGTGNVILYGCMKGEGTTTAFSYSAPYHKEIDVNPNAATETVVKSQGAVWNNDGTVTLKGFLPANGNTGNVMNINNSYIAFDAEYGLNTTVEVEFQGNNMPYFMFCADAIDGDMTNRDNGGVGATKGKLFVNGMITKDSATTYTRDDVWATWGFARQDNNIDNAGKLTEEPYSYLTQKYLKEHATTNFKLTFRFYGNGQTDYVDDSGAWKGQVVVYRVKLFNMDNNEELVADTGEVSTGYREAQIQTTLGKDSVGGKIILYANMKGEDTCTTFKYKVPQQA